MTKKMSKVLKSMIIMYSVLVAVAFLPLTLVWLLYGFEMRALFWTGYLLLIIAIFGTFQARWCKQVGLFKRGVK
ncbi:MAG: hypothetical protein GY861_17240 [bacterium]|nr:hypothetical protein [bacterium]